MTALFQDYQKRCDTKRHDNNNVKGNVVHKHVSISLVASSSSWLFVFVRKSLSSLSLFSARFVDRSFDDDVHCSVPTHMYMYDSLHTLLSICTFLLSALPTSKLAVSSSRSVSFSQLVYSTVSYVLVVVALFTSRHIHAFHLPAPAPSKLCFLSHFLYRTVPLLS